MISKTASPFNGTTADDLVTGANKTMVGGGHYHQGSKGFQHWDLVAYNRLGYLEGQITRYISRARHKNGLEDFRKAHHYVIKMKELFSIRVGGIYGFFQSRVYEPQHETGVVAYNNVRRFCREQDLTTLETNAMLMACQWLTMQDLLVLESMTHELVRGAELSGVNQKVRAAVAELNRAGVLRRTDETETFRQINEAVRNATPRAKSKASAVAEAPRHTDWGSASRVADLSGFDPTPGYVCQDPDLQPAPRPHPNDTLYSSGGGGDFGGGGASASYDPPSSSSCSDRDGLVQVHPDSQQ